MRRLCKRHPNERLSAFQALNHPWFESDARDCICVSPTAALSCTYTSPPSCRYASRPGSACCCPMIAKFGCCAFTHPSEDLKPSLRIAALPSEPLIRPPEMWIAQLSAIKLAVILHEKPVDCEQRVRLMRHNCETEIGWSYVLIENADSGVCREGLVASCCVGLPQSFP